VFCKRIHSDWRGIVLGDTESVGSHTGTRWPPESGPNDIGRRFCTVVRRDGSRARPADRCSNRPLLHRNSVDRNRRASPASSASSDPWPSASRLGTCDAAPRLLPPLSTGVSATSTNCSHSILPTCPGPCPCPTSD